MFQGLHSAYHDLKQLHLLPFKILLFFLYGGQAWIFPFLTLQMWSLNLSLQDITIILAVQPIFGILATLFVQWLAQKVENVKTFFCFSLLVSAVCTNCLQLVPENHVHYSDIIFTLKCKTKGSQSTVLPISTDNSCFLKTPFTENVSAKVVFKFCNDSDEQNGLSKVYIQENRSGEFCFQSSATSEEYCVPVNSFLQLEVSGQIIHTQDLNNIESQPAVLVQSVTYNGTLYRSFRCSNATYSQKCIGTSGDTTSFCEGNKHSAIATKTFWVYFSIRTIMTIATVIVLSLNDVALATALEKSRGNVIFQRAWAVVSICVTASISGYLLDNHYSTLKLNNYSGSLYMFSIFYLCATLFSVFFGFKVKAFPMQKANLRVLLKCPVQLFFLIHIMFLGMSWGFLENFLFLYMKTELGANHLLLGLTTSAGCFVCFLAMMTTNWVMNKISYTNVLFASFLAYVAKFSAYFFVPSAALCPLVEILNGFTITLMVYGVTVCWTKLYSTSVVNTAMALWSATHFVLGRVVGTVVSGLIGSHWSFRTGHLVFAYFNLVMAFITFLMKCCYQRYVAKSSYGEEEATDRGRSEENEPGHAPNVVNRVSCLVFPFMECVGLSPFHVNTILRFSRSPTLAEEIWKRVNDVKDFQYFYHGSTSEGPRRKTAFQGRAPPSSRKSSAISFRSSLAPVPEEVTGTFTPETLRRPSNCSSVGSLYLHFHLSRTEQSAYELMYTSGTSGNLDTT